MDFFLIFGNVCSYNHIDILSNNPSNITYMMTLMGGIIVSNSRLAGYRNVKKILVQ